MDLIESPVSSHMETDEHSGGAVNGGEKTVDGGVLSQQQNLEALMGGIDHNINVATITLRPKINHSGPSTEKERIISGLHAPEVKAIIKNDREEARAGTEVFNVAMTVTSNPEFNFTVGRDGKPYERVANARATTGRGRGKHTKNLPRVTNKNLQRPLEAHADVGKQLKQVGGPKRKCSSNNTKATEGTEKKMRTEVETETL